MRRLAVGLLLVAGCSLPMPPGVRSVDGVQAEQDQTSELLHVIPPGPRDGQGPEAVVQAFLKAQASAVDRHAVARSFLTPAQAASWDDQSQVQVYDVGSLRAALSTDPTDGPSRATVTVQSTVTGVIDADGGYSPARSTVTEAYRLTRDEGEWRLAQVPPGLRLTAPDLDRAYRPTSVYYVAQVPQGGRAHLVPDRVFVPAGDGLAQRLVHRVLQDPSSALAGSVAFEPGLRADDVGVDGAGVVTVDLAAGATNLDDRARQDLSAQLVWTLRGLGPSFTGLRLRAGGQPLAIPGEDEVQDDGDWDRYAPEGVDPDVALYYAEGRRLRAVGRTLAPSTATSGGAADRDAVAVDELAVSPDGTEVALLTGVAPAPVTVRLGQPDGPAFTPAVTARDLRSPSYGSGERGLWLVRGSTDVVLLERGADRLTTVPVVGRPRGRLTSLAASRDGARVALVVDQRLYVARVDVGDGTVRLTGLVPLVEGLRVTDVSWTTSTELALVAVAPQGQAQLLRVAVDGSGRADVNSSGLVPTAVTSSARGLVMRSGPLLYTVNGRTPTPLGRGSSPAYPG